MRNRTIADHDTRSFLARVQRDCAAQLAADDWVPTWRQRFGFVQASFGAPGIHYEAWLQRGRHQVEVGLHLEAAADLNGWLLRRLADDWPALGHALGPGFELEQWTQSWGRVHTLLGYDAVDEDLMARTTECLTQCIRTLEPTVHRLLAERRS